MKYNKHTEVGFIMNMPEKELFCKFLSISSKLKERPQKNPGMIFYNIVKNRRRQRSREKELKTGANKGFFLFLDLIMLV